MKDSETHYQESFYKILEKNKFNLKNYTINSIMKFTNDYFFESFLHEFTLPKNKDKFEKVDVIDYINGSEVIFREDYLGNNNNLIAEIVNNYFLPEFGTEKYWEWMEKSDEFRQYFEKDFWQEKINCENFKVISDFQAYEDITIDKSQYLKYLTFEFNYEVFEWTKYIYKLCDFFFSSTTNISKIKLKSNQILIKEINNFLLLLEINEKKFKSYLKQGTISQPEILFSIIEINSDSKKPNSSTLIQSSIENPFLSTPALPIENFLAKKRQIKTSENTYSLLSTFETFDFDDKMVIKYEAEIADALKKHLYYYFYLMSYYSKSYLNYIEECLWDFSTYQTEK